MEDVITVGQLINALKEYPQGQEIRISYDSDVMRKSIAGLAHVVGVDIYDQPQDIVLLCQDLKPDTISENWTQITEF